METKKNRQMTEFSQTLKYEKKIRFRSKLEFSIHNYGLDIHSTGAQTSKIVQQLHQKSLGMSTVNLGFHSRTAHFHIAQKQSNF